MARITAPTTADVSDPYAIIDAGQYTLRCVDCEFTESKKDAPMLRFMHAVTAQADGDIEHIGKNVFDYVVLGEDNEGKAASKFSLWRLHQYKEVVGIPQDETDFDTDQFLNMEFDGEITVTPPRDGYPEGNSLQRVYLP